MSAKECLWCNDVFEPENPKRKYCSRSCKDKYLKRQNVPLQTCPVCDITFQPSEKGVVFCSTSCASKAVHLEAQRQVTCQLCEKEFTHKGTGRVMYCRDCRRQKQKERVIAHRVKQGALRELGIGSGGWQQTGRNSTTLSQSGIVNHQTEYLERCYLKFNGEKACVICSTTRSIHVHHIDHDHMNNSVDNLTYLCSTCHIRHHRTNVITTEEIVNATTIKLQG